MWVRSARARLWRWLVDEIVRTPLEPILHPSRARLHWAGFAIVVGNMLFGSIWARWIPQPYENLLLRGVAASLGLFFFAPSITIDCTSQRSAWVFSVICWLTMPAYFFWMYWMNGGNPVWLASVSAMILIYYHLTDWRLATFGSGVAVLLSWLLADSMRVGQTASLGIPIENAVVIGFAWVTSMLLGFSSANLRRTRLINTLSTMGVMAHELRTPLATVNLMGDVLRNLAQNDLPEGKRKKLEELSTRLQNLVRSMNRQIDTQISNAQLLRLPRERSAIMAAELVHEVVAGYPYRSSRERDCVLVHLQQDFCFVGSRPLFAQVLANLIKNALHSLASAGTAPQPGDLRIDVGLHRGKGRIAVSDQGVGIPHEKQARIFELFSTQSGRQRPGLTFCKNVVETVHGQLSVHSEPAEGAVFMIDLPLDATPSN
jgi:signal transduction histidine kinase